MRYLTFVRHGDYKQSGSLTKSGREKIIDLSQRLKDKIAVESVLIVTSDAIRALETAEILSLNLQISIQVSNIFFSNNRFNQTDIFPVLNKIIDLSKSVDMLIIVTHDEIARLLPSAYGTRILSVKFPIQSLSTGDALMIDCKLNTQTII